MLTKFDESTARGQAQRDGITHLATGVAVVRDGKVLLVRRAAHDSRGGHYELPGGGVDDGETVSEGAIRELREETGLIAVRLIGTFAGFDYTTSKKLRVRQFNFLAEIAPGEVTLDPNEHDAYKWVDETSIADLDMSDEMRMCVSAALDLARHT